MLHAAPALAVGNEFRPGDWFMNVLRRHAAIAGSRGAAWAGSLKLEGAAYFPKWAGSAFVNPDFEACLKSHRITSLTLTGVFARACVSATARDALARGYGRRTPGRRDRVRERRLAAPRAVAAGKTRGEIDRRRG